MVSATPPPAQGSGRSPQSGNDTALLSPKSTNEGLEPNGSLRRKGSFSFLRRSKSRDRSASTGQPVARKLSRKSSKKMREEEMRRLREQIGERPPRIPAVPSQPEIHNFGGGERREDSAAIMSNRSAGTFPQRLAQKTSTENLGNDLYRGMPVPPVPPIPPIPGHTPTQAGFESMANRGRYSYASSAISTINSPRKIRRRKDPVPFNVLVLGSQGCGKTSFVNFLQTSLAMPSWKRRQSTRDDFEDPPPPSEAAFPNFTSTYVETEVGSERIGVTLWDSEGLEKNIIDGQLKEMTGFIESKFEDTFIEESRVARAPGFRDTHIHCVIMLLDPQRLDATIKANQKANMVNGAKAKANSFVKARPEPTPNGLDDHLDLNILRALKGKTTVVPVISKADTITTAHLKHLKRAVWDSMKRNGLDSLEALDKDEDDLSDTSTEQGEKAGFDERDEDAVETSRAAENKAANNDDDKFSTTSHLDSPSSSESLGSTDFHVAKPGQVSKDPGSRRSSSSEEVRVTERHLLPFSILSPDPYETETIGRRFPWGFADPHNPEHCDFKQLKNMIFTEWRLDLREASRELWYEGWRTSKLNKKNKRNAMSLEGNVVQPSMWSGPSQAKAYPNQPWAQ